MTPSLQVLNSAHITATSVQCTWVSAWTFQQG